MINAEESNEDLYDVRPPLVIRDTNLNQSARMKLRRRPALFLDATKRDSGEYSYVRNFSRIMVGDFVDREHESIMSPDSEIKTRVASTSAYRKSNMRNSFENAVIEEGIKNITNDESDAYSSLEVMEDSCQMRQDSIKRSESAENLLSILQTVNDVNPDRLVNIKQLLNHESQHLALLLTIQQYKYILQESKVHDEIIWNIFYNISDLIYAQKSLVNYLESLITAWDNTPVHFVEIMDLYTLLHNKCKDYVKNISVACRELKILFEKSEKFRSAMEVIIFDRKSIRLEQLLAKPTSWLCNSLELIKNLIETADGEKDRKTLEDALQSMTSNSEEFKKSRNTLEKNTFLRSNLFVEQLPNDQRKLRHIFLFSGILVCAKQKLQSQNNSTVRLLSSEQDDKNFGNKEYYELKSIERFEVKWFISLKNIVFHLSKNVESTDRRKNEIATLKEKIKDLKVQLTAEKEKLNFETDSQPSKSIKRSKSNNFSLRKMMIKKEIDRISNQILKIQIDLLLISPTVPFIISNGPERVHTLLVQSVKDLETWKCDILKVQREQKDVHCTPMTLASVNTLLEDNRRYTSIIEVATSPLSHNDGVSGILITNIHRVSGLNPDFKYHLSIEVDSFKHIELKARTKLNSGASSLTWNESFDIDLDCSQTLNILLYEQKNYGENKESLIGFFEFKLKSKDMDGKEITKVVTMLGNESVLLTLEGSFKIEVKGVQMKRQPSIMKTSLFGTRLKDIVSRERNRGVTVSENVPIILVYCLKWIEDVGINEEGIYRISGSKNEITELYKKFNKNPDNAVKNLGGYDLHSITGIVKTYLRELPEPLMMTENYEELLRITRLEDEQERFRKYQEVLLSLPEPNYSTLLFLLRHFEKVCAHSDKNQMIAGNLGLILGPTLIMPSCDPVKEGVNIALETMHRMLLARVFTHIMHGLCKGHIIIN